MFAGCARLRVCTTTDTERSAAVATHSTAVAVDTARASAAADSALRDARLSRLRTLQPTVDDLAARDTLDIRVEVDIQARRVRILDARSDTLAQHAIAVGSKEWPTRTGEWRISQVVLNPEWIPPTDESWAKDEKNSLPGDPDNPLGRAQLVYDLLRSIRRHQRARNNREGRVARLHSGHKCHGAGTGGATADADRR